MAKIIYDWLITITFGAIAALIAFVLIGHAVQSMQKLTAERAEDAKRRIMEIAAKQKQAQETENARKRQITAPQTPQYMRILVKGKSAKECAGPGGTLDNRVVACMNDHYEMVPASAQ
jgi:cation transport ATPase